MPDLVDPLRISTMGLSEWESVFVQTTVDLASGIDIAPCRFVSDPGKADVLFVDTDQHQPQGPPEIQEDEGPIVVSFSGECVSKGHGLTRPVGYADLIALLKEIETELKTASRSAETAESDPPAEAVKRNEPAETSEPRKLRDEVASPAGALASSSTRKQESLEDKARPARRFVEGTRFLGVLKQLIGRGRPAAIRHPDFPPILVFPEDNAYVSSINALTTTRLFRNSAIAFETWIVDDAEVECVLASDRCRPLDHLLYCAALFGSEGRVPLNVDLNDSLRLITWPDFDAVPHLHEHRKIAKYMLVHTSTLGAIAATTGVNIDSIIDFCNACEAAGLLQRHSADGTKRTDGRLITRMRGFFRS